MNVPSHSGSPPDLREHDIYYICYINKYFFILQDSDDETTDKYEDGRVQKRDRKKPKLAVRKVFQTISNTFEPYQMSF